jgi:hypothetical protein
MEETKRNQLGTRLKKMIDDFIKEQDRRKQPLAQPGIGNVIRRREGQKEKRFFLIMGAKQENCGIKNMHSI